MKSISIKVLCLFFFVFVALSSFAQDKREHVVAKGETVSSIASKYNVSEAALISENPILKNYIYVGMKIRIPDNSIISNDVEVEPRTNQTNIDNSQETTNNQQNTPSPAVQNSQASVMASSPASEPGSFSNATKVSRWGVADKVGYYFIPGKQSVEGVSISSSSLEFAIGADFSIVKYFFVEGLLGYNFGHSMSKMGSYQTTTTSHTLSLSQMANVVLPIGKIFGVGLFTGPQEYLFLTGEIEQNKQKTKIETDNPFSFSYNVGAKIFIGTFTLGVEYKISLVKGGTSLLGFFIGYSFG